MTVWEWIATVVLGIPGAIAVIALVAMLAEGYGAQTAQIERCRAMAATPIEYHRC